MPENICVYSLDFVLGKRIIKSIYHLHSNAEYSIKNTLLENTFSGNQLISILHTRKLSKGNNILKNEFIPFGRMNPRENGFLCCKTW